MLKDKLREARKSAKMTQKQVAEAIGVTESAYCGYETGKRQPDVLKIKQIAAVLGTTGDFLLETSASVNQEIEMDDFTYAMHNHSGNLTEKDKEILLSMASQLATARKKRKQNGETD